LAVLSKIRTRWKLRNYNPGCIELPAGRRSENTTGRVAKGKIPRSHKLHNIPDFIDES